MSMTYLLIFLCACLIIVSSLSIVHVAKEIMRPDRTRFEQYALTALTGVVLAGTWYVLYIFIGMIMDGV